MKQKPSLFTTQSREFLLKTELAKKYSHSTYLASSTNEPDHKVVLTVFTSWVFSLPHEREKLFLKAEGIKKLKHPHLIPILDMGIEKEQPFIVREYLPNGSLRSHLKKISPKGLPLRDALNIVSQVGQALVSIHEHHVVHGNVKPENILFDTDGQIRLTDFSLIPRSDVLIRDHIADEYAFCYMAPEQFGGIADARSDQYALGCLAYELITGQVPFAVQSLSSILGHQNNARPAPLSESVADLPRALEVAVLKALARDPAERFFDFSLFLEVIQSALAPPPAFPILRSTYYPNKRTFAHPKLQKDLKDASSPFMKHVIPPTSVPQPSEGSGVSSAIMSIAISEGISSAIMNSTLYSLSASEPLVAGQDKTDLLFANPFVKEKACSLPVVQPVKSVHGWSKDTTSEMASVEEKTHGLLVVQPVKSVHGWSKDVTSEMAPLSRDTDVRGPRIARTLSKRGWIRNLICLVLLIFVMPTLIIYTFFSFVIAKPAINLGTMTNRTYVGDTKATTIPKVQPSVVVAESPILQFPLLIPKNSTIPSSSQTPIAIPILPISQSSKLPSFSQTPIPILPVSQSSNSHGHLLNSSGWIASASSLHDLPLNALDGDSATRWSTGHAQTSGDWFLVDMGSLHSFSSITLDSGTHDQDYPHEYQVFVSTDGFNWGNSIASDSGSGQVVTISFATQSARFIKVVLTANASKWWSIDEFNVYDASGALNRSGWTASASSSNLTPSNALDGDSATRWSTGHAQTSGDWFLVDMGSTHSFTRITLDSGTHNQDYPRGYQVFVSNDGSSWGNAIASGNGSGPVVTISFATQSARFIKVVLTVNASKWWSIGKFKVYS